MEVNKGFQISELGEALIQGDRTVIEKYQKLSPNIYQDIQMGSTPMTVSIDHAYADLPVPLHSHTFCEMSFCHNKEPVYYLVGTQQYSVRQGDIILIGPGTLHKPVIPPDRTEPFTRTLVLVNRSFVQTLLENFPRINENRAPYLLMHTADTEWEFLESRFATLLREYNGKAYGYEGVLSGILTELVFYIFRANRKEHLYPEEPGLMNQALAYIEKKLSGDLSVESVAAALHISQSALTKLFRARLNTSPHSYITQRRMELAKVLIAGNQAFQTVYRDCGYEEYSSFYRAFRKEYGISPQEYQNIVRKNDTAVLPLG